MSRKASRTVAFSFQVEEVEVKAGKASSTKSGAVKSSSTPSVKSPSSFPKASSSGASRVSNATKTKAAQSAKTTKKVGHKSHNKVSKEGTHGYPYQKARKEFMINSLSDPKVGKDIKGWIIQEKNRVGNSRYWRSPPGYDVGHKEPGIDKANNLHWEYSSMNRRKGAKYKR
jgi:hypothetical protein